MAKQKYILTAVITSPFLTRKSRIESLADETRTMVFYESPYRLVKTLLQFAEFFGEDRQACVCREISKMFEESVRGTLAEIAAHFTTVEPKGEIVIVVAGKNDKDIKNKNTEK